MAGHSQKLAQLVESAKATLLKRLTEHGIQDQITCKIRPLERPEWLALYRSGTQFRSKPTFWINSTFLKAAEGSNLTWAMNTTIAHEYGHVIEEWAHRRADTEPEAKQALALIKSFGSNEDYAEDFARWLEDDQSPKTEHPTILQLFRTANFEP